MKVENINRVKIIGEKDHVKVELRCTLDYKDGEIVKFYNEIDQIEGAVRLEVGAR